MEKISFEGRAQTGDVTLDYGIRDIVVVNDGRALGVFASSGSYGGLTGYTLRENRSLTYVDDVDFNPVSGAGLSVDLALLETHGRTSVMVGGTGAGALTRYDVTSTGQIGSASSIAGVDRDVGALSSVVQVDDKILAANAWGSGFGSYDITSNTRVTEDEFVVNGGQSLAAGVRDIVTLEVSGQTYVVTAVQGIRADGGWSAAQTGISSYQIRADEIRPRDTLAMTDGEGLLIPTDMDVVHVGSQSFVVLASAHGASGALSVLQIAPGGALLMRDHLGDTRDTRFGAAQAVATVEVEGRAFVVAGGGDDGLSLFTLTPAGRLILLDTFENTVSAGLDGITALELAVQGDLQIFASAQSTAGVIHLSVDLGALGAVQTMASGGDSTSGTSGSDMLVGRGGNDRLSGGSGNDIILDGVGSDTMTGGSGADTFVLSADGARDRITDFDTQVDTLDLGDWFMFNDPAGLRLSTISGGVRLQWDDEELDLLMARGGSRDFDDVRAAVQTGGTRLTEDPSLMLNGGRSADRLTGDWGADTIKGGGGNDVISGGGGSDFITGGTGNDRIDGGGDTDFAYLEVGQAAVTVRSLGGTRIEITSSRGLDTYSNIEEFVFTDGTLDFDAMLALEGMRSQIGSNGSNRLTGNGAQDRLIGNAGNDTLNGQSGDDVLEGGRAVTGCWAVQEMTDWTVISETTALRAVTGAIQPSSMSQRSGLR